MRRKRNFRARPGHYLMVCDLSGEVHWEDEMLKMWDGKIVYKNYHEKRNAQDFVRGKVDDQSVPDARPKPDDVFVEDAYPNGVSSDDL